MTSRMNKTLIINAYENLMRNSDEFIIQVMNSKLNNEVLKLSKKSEIPVEVLFFPSSQIPAFSVQLYKQIQKINKKTMQLPPKIFILSNVLGLLKKMDPILYKVILDKKIDVYKHLSFNNSLYF